MFLRRAQLFSALKLSTVRPLFIICLASCLIGGCATNNGKKTTESPLVQYAAHDSHAGPGKLQSTNTKHSFDELLASGACSEAGENIPAENDLKRRVLNRTEQAGGSILSYAFTGASYTAEVLWDLTAGTVMFVALCGPTLAVMVAAQDSSHNPATGSLPVVCLPGKIGALSSPPLGRDAYEATKNLRCPVVTELSQSLRKIATCYENKHNPADLQKSLTTLQSIENSGNFYECLPMDERNFVTRERVRVEKLLTYGSVGGAGL